MIEASQALYNDAAAAYKAAPKGGPGADKKGATGGYRFKQSPATAAHHHHSRHHHRHARASSISERRESRRLKRISRKRRAAHVHDEAAIAFLDVAQRHQHRNRARVERIKVEQKKTACCADSSCVDDPAYEDKEMGDDCQGWGEVYGDENEDPCDAETRTACPKACHVCEEENKLNPDVAAAPTTTAAAPVTTTTTTTTAAPTMPAPAKPTAQPVAESPTTAPSRGGLAEGAGDAVKVAMAAVATTAPSSDCTDTPGWKSAPMASDGDGMDCEELKQNVCNDQVHPAVVQVLMNELKGSEPEKHCCASCRKFFNIVSDAGKSGSSVNPPPAAPFTGTGPDFTQIHAKLNAALKAVQAALLANGEVLEHVRAKATTTRAQVEKMDEKQDRTFVTTPTLYTLRAFTLNVFHQHTHTAPINLLPQTRSLTHFSPLSTRPLVARYHGTHYYKQVCGRRSPQCRSSVVLRICRSL